VIRRKILILDYFVGNDVTMRNTPSLTVSEFPVAVIISGVENCGFVIVADS